MGPVSSAADLIRTATEWLAEDPDPETRAELSSLLEAGDIAAIADRFAGDLEFGTAGFRGPRGAGADRMKPAVVRRAGGGFGACLQTHADGFATDHGRPPWGASPSRHARRGHRLRRAAQVRSVRHGYGGGRHGRRASRHGHAESPADAGPGVRGSPPRNRCRRDGDRLA